MRPLLQNVLKARTLFGCIFRSILLFFCRLPLFCLSPPRPSHLCPLCGCCCHNCARLSRSLSALVWRGWLGDRSPAARPPVMQAPPPSVEPDSGIWWHLAFYFKNIMHQCWHSVCIKFMMYVAVPEGAAAERDEEYVTAEAQTHTQLHRLSMHLYWLIEVNAHTFCFKSRSWSFTSDFISHASPQTECNWIPYTDSRVPKVLHFIHSPQINSRTTLFMTPPIYVTSQPSFSPPPLALSSLSVSQDALSVKQWYSPLTNNDCQVLLERKDCMLKEGTRGCKDNGFL